MYSLLLFWSLKLVCSLFALPHPVTFCCVHALDCAMLVPVVGMFGWSCPEDTSVSESTQKPAVPVAYGEETVSSSPRATSAVWDVLVLFQLSCPALAGLKDMLSSQGLVDMSLFWNSMRRKWVLATNTWVEQYGNGLFGLKLWEFCRDLLSATHPPCWKKNLLLTAGTLWKL